MTDKELLEIHKEIVTKLEDITELTFKLMEDEYVKRKEIGMRSTYGLHMKKALAILDDARTFFVSSSVSYLTHD